MSTPEQMEPKAPLETPFSFITTRMYAFNKTKYLGQTFNYPEQKGLLDNISEIQNLLNPPNHDRSKTYEKDLTGGMPYFAGW